MFWIISTIVLYLAGAAWAYKEQTSYVYTALPKLWSRDFWMTVISIVFWFALVIWGVWDDCYVEWKNKRRPLK